MKPTTASAELKLPRLEDIDPEYAALVARNDALAAKETELKQKQAEIYARIQREDDGATVRQNRVASLLTGAEVAISAIPARDELAVVARDLRDLADARHLLGGKLRERYTRASAKACEGLADRRKAIVVGAFEALADVAAARLELAEMQRQVRRAGIEPIGILDPLDDLFGGESITWNADLAIDLRRAVRDGFLTADKIPAAIAVKESSR